MVLDSYALDDMHSACSGRYSLSDLWVHYSFHSMVIKNITLQSLPSYEDVKRRMAAKTSIWRLDVLFLLLNS